MTSSNEDSTHVCEKCVMELYKAHRKALERVLDIANTRGVDAEVKWKGMADAAFDVLSIYDGFYESCDDSAKAK